MVATTIRVHEGTKAHLDKFREYKNESYDEVISKLIFIVERVKDEPELNKETIEAIEKARERIRKGEYYTEDAARRILKL